MNSKNLKYKEITDYLFSLIPSTGLGNYKEAYGLKKIQTALELLGNPQEDFKSIHIAATSGKGSTSSFISQILSEHGFKVGMTLSPHIKTIRERIQINNYPINKQTFEKNLHEIFPVLQQIEKQNNSPLSYFETLIALAYYTFAKEKVDYAMIETGVGGTLDATNTIHNANKIAVIGRIGIDHQHILGSTISEIAQNKAGIIQKGQCAIYLEQSEEINATISTKAAGNKIYAHNHEQFWNKNFKDLNISSLPIYQIENLGLALETLEILSKRDGFKLNNKKIQRVIDTFHIKGRFETITIDNQKFILDGAHNPQKMNALINSLRNSYPDSRFDFIFACKEGKDYEKMLEEIFEIANSIILTEFSTSQDVLHKSIPTKKLAEFAKQKDFKNITIVSNPFEAIQNHKKTDIPIIITGSFYLLSEIYNKI